MRSVSAIVFIGILGSIPTLGSRAAAGVDIHIAIPPPPSFVIEAPPRLVVVPDTPAVYYAPDLPYNYFRYGGRYYTFHDGGWFVASGYGGPWTYVEVAPRALRVVPARYYRVRPKHFVTYRDHRHDGRGHGKKHHKKHHDHHDD